MHGSDQMLLLFGTVLKILRRKMTSLVKTLNRANKLEIDTQ
jgi:hypothetical protein